MNFWNMAVLGLVFLAPVATVFFLLMKRSGAPGVERRTTTMLFALAAIAGILGVAHYAQPTKIEFLWPLTLEQSGYFEFSLQMLWSRFVWIFYTSMILIGFIAYDGFGRVKEQRVGALSLIGSFFFAILAFLSENTILSLMFIEISVFMLYAFGMEAGGEEGDLEKASYYKRSCFIFIGLAGMFFIALSRQLNTSSVVLMGAVLYILATVVSKYNPTRWSQFPSLFVHAGVALFLLERVLVDEPAMELTIPLAAIFAIGTVLFSAFSLLSPLVLGSAFWMMLSILGYLLYLRFSSGHPTDPFWGAYEAIGLGAAYALTTIFRFGARLELFWKRAIAFALLAIFMGIISGALPSVEIVTARIDNENSFMRVVMLGFLTFFISTVSAKSLAVSLRQKDDSKDSPNTLLACMGPAFLVIAAQIGLLVRWSDLNLDSSAMQELGTSLYDLRVLISGTAVGAGILAGGLLGFNMSFANWNKNRTLRMEDFFPNIDPRIMEWNLNLVALPERGIDWLSARANSAGEAGARMLDTLDQGFFGEKFFRRVSEYGTSLSLFTRFFHSGQARAYLFLGVLITLISSMVYLMEGR